MKEDNHFQLRNNIIYYALKTDYNQSEEKSYEKDFNLETKKFIKDQMEDEFKKQRKKLYEECFNFKLKKNKIMNRPTPYQIFLKEKEYLKSMNDYKIKHNLNPLGSKISIITNKNKEKSNSSNSSNIKNSKSKTNLLLGQLSPILYLNKIKNYKKKNIFFDRL